MNTVTVSKYRQVEDALRQAHLKQSLYDEGAVLMDKVLVTLHGEEHRTRRSIESRLFQRNFFRYYETEVFPHLLSDTLRQFLQNDHCDLKDLGYRIMVHLSLSFAGIDRQNYSVEEADTLHELLNRFGHAATLGQFSGDRDAVRRDIVAALAEFNTRFFEPSRQRRSELVQRYRRGELSEEQLPRDILTILLLNAEKLAMADDLVLREVAFFYLASSHTSVHTLLHAVNEILHWQQGHDEQLLNDLPLLQKFVHESMRLHPSSPEARRTAQADIVLASGEQLHCGDAVVIDLQSANRDTEIFGEDAAVFNPLRQCPARISRTGLSFGGGMHVCLGMNLVAGTMLKPGAAIDAQNHQYGTIALVINALLQRGIEFDADKPPQKDAQSTRDLWLNFPVRFKHPAGGE